MITIHTMDRRAIIGRNTSIPTRVSADVISASTDRNC